MTNICRRSIERKKRFNLQQCPDHGEELQYLYLRDNCLGKICKWKCGCILKRDEKNKYNLQIIEKK